MFNFYPYFPFFQKRVWKTNSEPKTELFYFEQEEQKVPWVTFYNRELEKKFKSVDKDNEIYKHVLKEFEKYPKCPLGGECFAAAIAYLDSQKLREKGISFVKEDFKNYALAEYIVQYFQFKAFGYKYFSLFADYIYKKGCCCVNYSETNELQRIISKIKSFTGDDSIVQFFIEEERNYKYSEKNLLDKYSRENVPTEIVKSKYYCLFAKGLEEELETRNKAEITELKEKNSRLTKELENQKCLRRELEISKKRSELEKLINNVKNKIQEGQQDLLESLLKTQEEITRLQHQENVGPQIFSLVKRRLERDKSSLSEKINYEELSDICKAKEELIKLEIEAEKAEEQYEAQQETPLGNN